VARSAPTSRKSLNALPMIAPAGPEAEHFLTCKSCGQAIDLRNLGDVLHHEEPGHAPVPVDPEPVALRFIPPQLPSLADEPPAGDRWIHEIKYDGYRTQLHVSGGQVRTYTRNAFDWTERYHTIVRAAERLSCASAILDGEMIVQDEHGRCNFAGLRNAIAERPRDLVFMAFDLMHLDGRDMRKLPIEERRAALEALVGAPDPAEPIHFSAAFDGDGAELFAAADAMGLEGIISKRIGSRYVSGHGKSWLKIKTFEQRDYLVVGTERGKRAPVALLASEEDGALKYGGGAMVTLPEPLRDRFWQRAAKLRTDKPPLAMVPRKDATWLKPGLRVRVKTLRGEELARHATVTAIL
jgi:bifunctional non-homologous end joining protein LigD